MTLTSIVFISNLTFSSSSTGGMGLLITCMGTWWTSVIPAECTLLIVAIAPVTGSIIKQTVSNLLKSKHGGFLAIIINTAHSQKMRKRRIWNWEFGMGSGSIGVQYLQLRFSIKLTDFVVTDINFGVFDIQFSKSRYLKYLNSTKFHMKNL